MVKTFSYRIKDSSCYKILERMARSVNYVWNYCNHTQKEALRHRKRWPTWIDLNNLTGGCAKELGIHSQTVRETVRQYWNSRSQRNRPYLRWRSKKSLGWIPFNGLAVKVSGDSVRYYGQQFRFWCTRKVPSKILGRSSFSQDARGRWYVNLVCEVTEEINSLVGSVGIDLGLSTLATCSNSQKYSHPKAYRKYSDCLANAQRKGRRKLARSIHARIKNVRKDFNHKVSHELTRDNNMIVVGNVNSTKIAKTGLAKSVYDAAWSQLRSFLKYKAVARGGTYVEVDEAFTTRTCSNCSNVGGPQGREGLSVREWVCSNCNCHHDRDVNAAINILRLGHQSLLLKGSRSTESSERIQ